MIRNVLSLGVVVAGTAIATPFCVAGLAAKTLGELMPMPAPEEESGEIWRYERIGNRFRAVTVAESLPAGDTAPIVRDLLRATP